MLIMGFGPSERVGQAGTVLHLSGVKRAYFLEILKGNRVT